MITCPHCGFKQPEDIFCAKCGVNIETYTPKKRPFFQNMLESSLFYIILLLFVVSATTFLTYEKILIHFKETPTDSFSYHTDYTIPNPPPFELSKSSETSSDQLDLPNQQVNALSQNEDVSPQNSENTPAAENAVEDVEFSSGVIDTYFIALPTDTPLIRTADLQSNGQYGVISNFAQALEEIPRNNILMQRSWQIEPQNFEQRIFALRREENLNEINNAFGQIGIVMEWDIHQISARDVVLQPQINLFLVETIEGHLRPFQDSQDVSPIRLNRGEAAFIFVSLPNRPLSSIEQELFPETLRSLIESEDFIQNNIELFIVIEYAL